MGGCQSVPVPIMQGSYSLVATCVCTWGSLELVESFRVHSNVAVEYSIWWVLLSVSRRVVDSVSWFVFLFIFGHETGRRRLQDGLIA